jgi:hypothetical protein
MNKQQKLKIALPILFLIVAFVWGPAIFGGGSKKKGEHAGNVDLEKVLTGSNLDLIALAQSSERKKAVTSYADWGRNPFMLQESPKASVLEGILWDTKNPKVIINGNILGLGDKVGSGEIVDIKQTSVTIKDGTEEKVYRLGE